MTALVVKKDGKEVQVFELQAAKITIGRKGTPGPDRLLLDDSTISTNHAILERHGAQYMIQDMNSRNGVMLNDKILPPGRLYPIAPTDKIQICDFTLELAAAKATPAAKRKPGTLEAVPVAGLPSSLGGFAIQKVYAPRAVVGGDFFISVRFDDDRLAVGIGDASGGGEPDIEVTVRCTEHAHQIASSNASPSEALQTFLQALRDVYPGQPVTFLFGILDAKEPSFRFANAGHVAPIFFNRGDPSKVRKLVGAGPPLVGGTAPPAEGWEERRAVFQEGDILVLMTDGIPNASAGGGKAVEMGLKNGIRETLMQSWALDLPAFLKAMKKKIGEVEMTVGPFGFEGVARIVGAQGGEGVKKLLPAVERAIRDYIGDKDPEDDLTMIGFERLR
ncbi:MAG: SpoIIE family protein phosphatase [Planctomycetota bacterium]|jgi:hypothetical protein